MVDPCIQALSWSRRNHIIPKYKVVARSLSLDSPHFSFVSVVVGEDGDQKWH